MLLMGCDRFFWNFHLLVVGGGVVILVELLLKIKFDRDLEVVFCAMGVLLCAHVG